LVDQSFYDTFIGPYDSKHVRKAFEEFYKMLRTRDMLANTADQNKGFYEARIKKVLDNSRDYNIDLFQTKLKAYYTMLIEGQGVYDAVMGIERDDNNSKEIESKVIETKMKTYLSSVTDGKYASILSTFDLDKKAYGDKKKTEGDNKKLYAFFKQVLNKAFGIDVSVSSRGTKNDKRKNYNNKKIVVSLDDFYSLTNIYHPSKLSSRLREGYALVDELEI
jgi:hypothetical protein